MKKKLFTLIMMLISFSIQIFAQMRDYTAMVVDAETGEALHYASVYIAENRGTITNQDGKFLISASPEEILQIKFIGYENFPVKLLMQKAGMYSPMPAFMCHPNTVP